MEKKVKVIFAGGGTGGHLFPAIAMAEEFKKRYPESEVFFVGTKRGLEAKVVLKRGFKLHYIKIKGIKRRLDFKILLFPFYVLLSLLQSYQILKGVSPDLVVGTGGYVSFPVVFLASLKNIPSLIQEQNSYPGISTRILSLWADRVCLAYPESIKYFIKKKNLKVIGNPVREDISERFIEDQEIEKEGGKKISLKKFNLESDKKTVFILGGSQGSKAINDALLDGLDLLEKEKDIQILWQTGKSDYLRIKDMVKVYKSKISVLSFIENMSEAYKVSDLLVSRAGALTLAEILCCGKPALLIPYPFAASDHQRHNAESLKEGGAAEIILQKDLNGRALFKIVLELLKDEQRLKKMAEASKRLSQPEATSYLVDEMVNLLSKRSFHMNA